MVVQAVSFMGAQPGVQQQDSKKRTYAVPGIIIGAAVGGGIGGLTSLGRTPVAADADEFIRNEKATDMLSGVTDNQDEVAKLKAAKTAYQEAGKVVEEDLKSLFPEGTTEAKISDVLAKVKGAPDFEAIKDAAGKEASESNIKLQALAEALNITNETKDAEVKVSQDAAKKALTSTTDIVTDDVKTAFDKVKGLLKGERATGRILAMVGAGAAIAGVIGYMMKKKEN